MSGLSVTKALGADARAINRVYNYYVANTTVTFDADEWSDARREQWLKQFTAPHHALVAKLDEQLIGFAYNTQFRARAAYQSSTEVTIYTDATLTTRGAGGALYTALFKLIAQTELHRAYAVIAQPNPRSVAFHQKFGFTPVGTLREVGYKFGRYVDVTWFEKSLR